MAEILMAHKLFDVLVEHGIIPEKTRRVVIDIRHDAVVEVFYACAGDERLLNVNLPAYLKDAIKIQVGEDSQPEVDPPDADLVQG